jgi:hypothetical protein
MLIVRSVARSSVTPRRRTADRPTGVRRCSATHTQPRATLCSSLVSLVNLAMDTPPAGDPPSQAGINISHKFYAICVIATVVFIVWVILPTFTASFFAPMCVGVFWNKARGYFVIRFSRYTTAIYLGAVFLAAAIILTGCIKALNVCIFHKTDKWNCLCIEPIFVFLGDYGSDVESLNCCEKTPPTTLFLNWFLCLVTVIWSCFAELSKEESERGTT